MGPSGAGRLEADAGAPGGNALLEKEPKLLSCRSVPSEYVYSTKKFFILILTEKRSILVTGF